MATFPTATYNATFWRSLQTLNVSRVVVALILLVFMGVKGVKGMEGDEYLFLHLTAYGYLALAIAFVFVKVYYQKRFMLQLAMQIALDIGVITVLYVSSGGGKSGLAILYLFPLAGAGILARLTWSLFFVSVVTLLMLADSAYRLFQQEDGASISQAGLYGAAYFGVVLVVNRLAGKLINQEELAHRRGLELAVQQAINRLVIADMGDGILVVDQNERLFEINPAAERMLGVQLSQELDAQRENPKRRPRLKNIAVMRPIAEALRNRSQLHSTLPWGMESDTSFVSVRSTDQVSNAHISDVARVDVVTHLKLRFVNVDTADILNVGSDFMAYTIIFMQDVSDIENKAQQLKLASMGRLTASIAHEVRNPLSSISYAASLLTEDMSDPAQAKRLLKIVDDNVGRLNKLIEDILKLSRKAQASTEPFQLMPVVSEILQEFVETHGLVPGLITLDDSVSFKVVFDVGHLREIIVNLLSNALRYASGQPGSIRIYAAINAANRQELHIQDDGPGIAQAVRSHLFEPFYTTSSKGTGLGLYMARELCLNNQALLDYDYRSDDSQNSESAEHPAKGSFVINFSLTGVSA